MKVVFDTMMWVSYCTLKNGFRSKLIQRPRRQRVRMFVSEYILDELTSALTEDLKRSRRFASLARRAVLRLAKLVELPLTIRRYVPGDPEDDPILQTALTAKADYLITADSEILKVCKIKDLSILTASQFADHLEPVGD